jgi:hypothetical protein
MLEHNIEVAESLQSSGGLGLRTKILHWLGSTGDEYSTREADVVSVMRWAYSLSARNAS